MPVLIGGSPSTGSSLLRQMLNRHSAIYCGPETQLFTHPQLFEKWEKLKNRILHKPLLTSPDMHLTRGANLAGHEQGWSKPDITALIDESRDFMTFCDAYFNHSTHLYGKDIWMDKTPSNVLSFNAFGDAWDEGMVVHITRDPLDIVVSLIQRGLSLFLAVSRFVFNTAHALTCMESENYLLLRYEQLVNTPELALEPLLEKLGLRFERAMLDAGNPQMTEVHQMPGWRSSEIDLPNPKSVGRFKSLSHTEQTEIIAAINIVQLNPDYAHKHGLPYMESRAISESLGYAIPTIKTDNKREIMKKLRSGQRHFRKQCLRERRLFYEKARPIVLV